MMKTIRFKRVALFLVGACMLACCAPQAIESEEDFVALEETLKTQFGEKSHYTNIQLVAVPKMGSSIAVTVARDPSALKMEEWICTKNNWTQTADVTVEIPEESVPQDFMFNLREVSLRTLGKLVAISKKSVQAEKGIADAKLVSATVRTPNRGEKTDAHYTIALKSESDGAEFSYTYNLQGDEVTADN